MTLNMRTYRFVNVLAARCCEIKITTVGSQIRRHILICRVMSMSFMTRISDDPMTPLAIADGTPRSISSD